MFKELKSSRVFAPHKYAVAMATLQLKLADVISKFASAKCKNDPELVLQAVTQAGSAAMHHASDALKNQNKFVLFATVGLGDQDLWVHISDKLGADDDVEGLAEKVYDKNGGDPAFNALVGKPPGNGGDDPSDVPVALSEYDDTHS